MSLNVYVYQYIYDYKKIHFYCVNEHTNFVFGTEIIIIMHSILKNLLVNIWSLYYISTEHELFKFLVYFAHVDKNNILFSYAFMINN